MNYLAHTLLSCEDEELLIGNFLADFINNKEVAVLSEGMKKGVELHRLIDSFTDSHPVVKSGIHRLQKKHGKYAGVVIDIFYDYILANNWASYGPDDLQSFADKTYKVLAKHVEAMPERLHEKVPKMIADNWLVQYGKLEGIAYTFEWVQKRASKPAYFDNVLVSLAEEEAQLTKEFAVFFPDMFREVGAFCNC